MALVPAGYDRLSKAGRIGDDMVITSGLANCIAVVAQATSFASVYIAHVNTMTWFASGKGEVQSLTRNCENLRNWLHSETRADKWFIGLGGIWYNTAIMPKNPDKPTKDEKLAKNLDDKRFILIKGLYAAFGVEPRVAASCVSWSEATGLQVGDKALLSNVAWEHEGKEIPYATLW